MSTLHRCWQAKFASDGDNMVMVIHTDDIAMVLGYSDGGAFLCPREVGVGVGVGILMVIIISYRPTWCLRVDGGVGGGGDCCVVPKGRDINNDNYRPGGGGGSLLCPKG